MKNTCNTLSHKEICPSELAKKLLAEASKRSHPYMIYSKEDVPALREKVKKGISKKTFARLVETSDAYLSRSGKLYLGLHPAIGRMFQSRFAYLVLAGELTGDGKYIDKALELAIDAIESGTMEMYPRFNGALSVGDFAHAYALAYDFLYDRLTEEQKAAFRATMEQLGEWIYVNSPTVDTWGSQEPRRQAWNWNVITHGALGLMALSLGDHEDWLTLAIERLLGYCKYAVDETGAAMEGLHYIGFALNTLTPFDLATNRLAGVELMDNFPAMQSLPYWSMHMTAPFGGEQAAIGQGSDLGNYSSTYYIINRYKQADALWGWMNTYNLTGDGTFHTEYEGNGWSLPAVILFEDQTLVPELPTPEKNPLNKAYAKGIVIARDGWEKEASMATFNCGFGYAGCWNHPDDNTFTFYAKGEAFVIDLGAGRKSSKEHNVISVDGIGMDFEGGATMVIGTTEQNSVLEGGEIYLRGDNTSSYKNLAGLEKSIRHLIYCGGNTPFVIACDFAKKAGKHTYDTNFYTKVKNTVSISDDGKTGIITGGNQGSTCYMIPYSPNGITLTQAEPNVGFTTSSEGEMHKQATVFIAADSDKLPEINFSADADRINVEITLDGKARSYSFTINSLESPKTATTKEAFPIPVSVLQSIGQEAGLINT